MEYLYGIVNYIPAKPMTPKGEKRLGRLLVTEGEKAGQEVWFDLLEYPPPLAVRARSSVRLQGKWRDGVFEVPSRRSIARQMTRRALDVMLEKEFPHLNVEALIQTCGAADLQSVAERWRRDPESIREAAVQVANQEMAKKLDGFFSWYYKNDALQEVWAGLEKFNMARELDLPQVIGIYDLLNHRAARWQTTIWKAIENDPWLITQVEDVPFSVGDLLASRMGVQGLTEAQVAGAVMHVLWGMARSGGHVYVPVRIIYGRVLGELLKGVDEDKTKEVRKRVMDILQQLLAEVDDETRKNRRRWALRGGFKYDKTFASQELAEDYRKLYPGEISDKEANQIEGEGKGVYFTGLYWAEVSASKALSRLCEGRPAKRVAWLSTRALQFFPHLDDEQREAVEAAATYPVTLVTGQAGTGKTEVVAALTAAFTDMGLSVGLMAPTGVAAQRLTEKTGIAASTVHLKLVMTKDGADYAAPGRGRKAELEEDVLIVDEMSMCDINMFARLLSAIKPDFLDEYPDENGKRLVLTGDPAQLGSPGPGNVLGDLVRAVKRGYIPGGIKVVDLKTIHRQSPVLENCRRIRLGEKDLEYAPDVFECLRADAPDEALVSLLERLDAQGVPSDDVLVLCPVKNDTRVKSGADALNLRLQVRYNPHGEPIPGTRFWIGDKVLCVRNDYPRNGEEFEGSAARDLEERATIYNGMRGRIVTYDEKEQVIFVQYPYYFEPQPYRPAEADYYLNLGYASTVHKAQGAEVPVVVIVDYVPDRPQFTRSVLYTAVTRVKQYPDKPHSGRVYFVGPDGFVEHAVETSDRPRYSKFLYRIYAENGGEVTRADREIKPRVASRYGEPRLIPLSLKSTEPRPV